MLARSLVPGNDHWPGAGEAVVAYVLSTTEVQERLATDEFGGLTASELEASDPMLFTLLRDLVYEGYYADLAVAPVLEARTGYSSAAALSGVEMPSFDVARLVDIRSQPPRFGNAGSSDAPDDVPWPPLATVGPAATRGRRASIRREADVLVIGAGAAGAAVCARLAERGLDVICLEQGPWYPPAERPKAFADWEVRDRHAASPRLAARASRFDYPVTSVGDDLVDVMMVPAVGGSTVAYGGHFWRLSPSDFALGTSEGFGVDWPIGYDDLAPYYTRNERITGVSGLAGDPTGPPRAPSLHPPLPIGPVGERFADAFDRLGWTWWVQDQAIVSREHAGRPSCTNRGFCRLGCPPGSLSTADVTYWPRALHAGAELRTESRVRELTTQANGRARGAIYHAPDGALHEACAKVVVVCANGLGTPRLLLLSRPHGHPDGLANSSGLVGRNLMLHVSAYVFARFEDRLDTWLGPFGVAVTSRQFSETDPAAGFQRGHLISVCRGASPLATAFDRAPWGPGHHEALERYLGHEVGVWICGDDAPEPHNRVELDPDRTDSVGLAGLLLHYRLSENSLALAETALERVRQLADAAGADELIHAYGPRPVVGWHLLGTARMGSDPSSSVVDANHEAHDVPNLYIVDGSSMPTGGCVNPTNTIQALALRAADAIWEKSTDWRAAA